MKILALKVRDANIWVKCSIGMAIFWYVSLYPGRLDSDGSSALLMLSEGKSTNWWTATYFWFLKITTLNGHIISLTSLILLISLYYSLYYFIWSIPVTSSRKSLTLFIVCLTPLFGNFGVNISHDVFTCSGILLLTGYLTRLVQDNILAPPRFSSLILATLFLSNSLTGIGILVVICCVLVIFFHKYFAVILMSLLAITIFLTTSIGISKNPIDMPMLPILADMKCVAQHPLVELSKKQKEILFSIETEQIWSTPKTCSSIDAALSDFANLEITKFDRRAILKTYSEFIMEYPEIIIQTHLQRASVALPPPFFSGPRNMTDRNTDNPVGLGTNTALQSGSVVLHPSVDLAKFKLDNQFHRLLEGVALLPGFLINQASWFWGWGGLWLWPIFGYVVFFLRGRIRKMRLIVLMPVITNHLILLTVGPVPSPRYVMSTIIIGLTCAITLSYELLDKKRVH